MRICSASWPCIIGRASLRNVRSQLWLFMFHVKKLSRITPLVKRYHASLPLNERHMDAARVRLPYGVCFFFYRPHQAIYYLLIRLDFLHVAPCMWLRLTSRPCA
jgi:hypothetical protein